MLRVESMEVVGWSINKYYNTHDDCRDHTGVMISIFWFVVLISYLKEKVNVNFFKDGDILGSHDRINSSGIRLL